MLREINATDGDCCVCNYLRHFGSVLFIGDGCGLDRFGYWCDVSCINQMLNIHIGKVIIGDDVAGFVTNHIVIANDFVFTHVCPFLGVNDDIEFTGGVGGIAN